MDVHVKLTPSVLSTVLGIVGLVAVVVAVGALTDWRWGLLVAGVLTVVVAWAMSTHDAKPAEVHTLRRKVS